MTETTETASEPPLAETALEPLLTETALEPPKNVPAMSPFKPENSPLWNVKFIADMGPIWMGPVRAWRAPGDAPTKRASECLGLHFPTVVSAAHFRIDFPWERLAISNWPGPTGAV